MENLLKHKLEKMLIFDQKILEVANMDVFPIALIINEMAAFKFMK